MENRDSRESSEESSNLIDLDSRSGLRCTFSLRILAAKSQPADGDHGYLMMKRTVMRCRSNCFGQAWPSQAAGAALPNGSSRRKSEAQISFPRHRHRSLQAPRYHKASHALITSGYIGPSPEIRQTINTHRPRAGQRFSPTHF